MVSRQSRETSAQRKIELMMPFYIVRKLVQNKKAGCLKSMVPLSTQVNRVDAAFRNYLLDVSVSMNKAEVSVYGESDQQFCKLVCP